MSIVNFEAPARTFPLEAYLDLDQAVLDTLPIGLYVCDADGHIVRFNKRAAQLWGRAPRLLDPAQRFCGSFRVESLSGDVIPPDQTPMARAVLTGARFEGVEARVLNPDGKQWVARVNVTPLFTAEGVIFGAVNCFEDITAEYERRAELERSQDVFDLAMRASNMGTWRYTLSDNICVYDENAQRLYGLTEARFLHDDEGVAAKFHPDDMALMWARVAIALEPNGEGRYDVEYRVKQLDDSWRWLSAWGLVEFEGVGPDRKPVAISGASRDLTERKRAEEMQQLLNNELNHRVKNALAIVQSIVFQTLRDADDMKAARTAVNARIVALAGAHDLLTNQGWLSADLKEVAKSALAPFGAGHFTMHGPCVNLPPNETLSISLALHELATNAAKYGALSTSSGRVELKWELHDQVLHLCWRESGGPSVIAPSRRGFGSRLIESGLFPKGDAHLEFAEEGVWYDLKIALEPVS